MNRSLKDKGQAGEELVAKHYQNLGYRIIERNYTFNDGELDIVAIKGDCLIFVEVKVVDHIEDLSNYVTPKKIGFLKRSIESYLTLHPTHHDISLDVAFVHGNIIIEVYENVTNS